ncbi:MAG TPA: magnesium transporter CorA family protein [Candidatus Paceibacterota bacterium]|nr:magnesium transporter CorA family protein [Candidatus Paceibacterota bacterium]
MITHYFRTVKDSELKELPKSRSGVWTHVIDPTDEEIAQLVGEYSLDEAILEDARDFFEVPRMERSQGATYFFTRYPYTQNQEDIDTAPLLIVMGESFVLTVALKEVPQFKPFIEGTEVVVTTQKAKLFIQIMAALTTAFERKLVRLRRAVHRDRAKIRQIGSREIERFVNYEHELSDMTAALIPTNAWLNQVTTGNFMQLYNDDIELMEDLMIANSQLVDSARTVMKTIQNVRSATEAILTNRLNTTIQTLTVLTILLTIPTVVSSIFGMNVPIPLADAPWMFAAILTTIGLCVLITVLVLKRNRWF